MTRTRVLLELVAEDGRLDQDAWRSAHQDRTPVALCGCGGPVVTDPREPEYREHFGVRWYAMRCQQCQSTSELPATRVLPTTDRRPSLARADAAAQVERRRLAETL